MKRKSIIFTTIISILFILSLTMSAFASTNAAVILIDPGHGGRYAGAISGSIVEKAVALKIANKLKTKLTNAGYTVIMSRTGDTDFGGATLAEDINKRVVYINTKSYHALVSIHVNSASITSRVGAMYQTGSSSAIGGNIDFAKHLTTNVYSEDLAILRDTTSKGVKSLIETARINNTNLLNDTYLDGLATQYYNGILNANISTSGGGGGGGGF